MFTGVVEGTGTVESITYETGRRSAIGMIVDLGKHAAGLKAGQSVALNGACLTLTERSGTRCRFEMIQETAKRTCLGGLRKGCIVNVERSLKVGGRLEGHFVLGHVDGTGIIEKIEKGPDQVVMQMRLPIELVKYVVEKGSIAVDGVSLTVVGKSKNTVTVCLIPHTMQVTNFARRHQGDKVNIETDILGKYILGSSERE